MQVMYVMQSYQNIFRNFVFQYPTIQFAIMKHIFCIVASMVMLLSYGCGGQKTSARAQLEKELKEYVASLNSRVGIAIIINRVDTIEVNGHKDFPMMSVMKFPQALAAVEWMNRNGIGMTDSVTIKESLLDENTYSPMLKKYEKCTMRIPFSELIGWSLIESDNNACDILFNIMGGIDETMVLLSSIGADNGITIGATEHDMYENNYTSYLNRSTPIAMAVLFDRFDNELRHTEKKYEDIAIMLEKCNTGKDRLPKALVHKNDVIGHKTGTGFSNDEGRISALNDCGYIHLSNGTNYTIAVFTADSGYDADSSAAIIANISEIVYNSLQNENR